MLSGGGFTGYVELSENVLSGDYYVAYYGGQSLSAAFVGASEELLTGDEAFETACDEVGIFQVVEVDLDVQDVPEPAGDEDDETAAAGAGASADPEPDAEPSPSAGSDDAVDAEPAPADDAGAESTASGASDASASGTDAPGAGEPSAGPSEPSAGQAGSAESPGSAGRGGESPDSASERAGGAAGDQSGPASDSRAASTESSTGTTGASTPDAGSSGQQAGPREPEAGDAAGATAQGAAPAGDAGTGSAAESPGSAPDGEDVFSEEAEWRETKTVPALDPDESEPADDAGASAGGPAGGKPASGQSPAGGRGDASGAGRQASGAGRQAGSSGRRAAGASAGRSQVSQQVRERVEKLEAAVEEREARIDDLESELAAARAERDDLREERDRLRAELEETQAELETARERLAEANDGGSATAAGEALSPAAALSGTNLFVRYDSKGEPTLDAVADGAAADEVNANVRVEHHTQFDAGDATVDGEPFESFLEDTLEYEFVSWLVRRLPYEIRDAGHQAGLADLYRAIPDVDRAELGGVVEVETEDGSASHEFDVVCRDKRGRPLAVAELNASRNPVTGDGMAGLVESATAVADGADSLGAGFFVTESYFEPDALSTATEASGSGLLSRDKRESFVKVGRKTGYHLCLVEARGGSFHVSIPEL